MAMAERSLMIRCAMSGCYFALGMDFPSARVFNVATGSLAAVVAVPAQSRTSLAVVSLTALALGTVDGIHTDVDALRSCYAAVGLSNGTVLLHHVEKDELVRHLAVSDTQQAIKSVAFCNRYLFCLTSNQLLQVVDCLRGECVSKNLRVQHDAGAIAVVEDKMSIANGACNASESVFRIFVAGPTNAVYTLCLNTSGNCGGGGGGGGGSVSGYNAASLDRLVSFASQASLPDFAWMGGTSQHPVVVTASAQDGVARVWDACPSVDGRTTVSRCRRSLMCGQRIVAISVQDATSCNSNSNGGSGSDGDGGEALVIATTFTGTVLVWELGSALLTPVADPMPTPPTLCLVSKETSGRLLFGAILQRDTSSMSRSSLIVLRGRFAVPRFEVVNLRDAAMKAKRGTKLAASLMMDGAVAVYAMPVGTMPKGKENATHADMEVLDHAWATHNQRQLLAARSMHTPSEGFLSPVPFHAKSVMDLPQKSLTLEQRLKQLLLSSPASHFSAQRPRSNEGQPQQYALGLATVPLYQALHANDASVVMELLTVASRSASDIRATIMGLQLPYCLQLLELLARRVRGATSRSPLFEWIDAIIHYRGVEMHHAQQQYVDLNVPAAAAANNKTSNTAVQELDTTATPSPPKHFVAPLLHQYRNMTALYDSLASMYGRISIFKTVRPSEQSLLVSSENGIHFPAMFTEMRCANGEYRTVRVRSKHDPRLQDGKKKNATALLRKARRIVAASADAASGGGGIDSESVNGSDALDMEALDKMDLSPDGDGDDDDDDDAGDGSVNNTKRTRREKEVAMLAESDCGSSYGVESSPSGHSSDAEFDPASDGDMNSSEASDDDDDDDDDESGSSSVVGDPHDDDGDDDDDDDDEDNDAVMELLEAHGDASNSDVEEQLERQRFKRVRIDN